VPSSPSVAIVILNWNGQKMLEKFLPFVLSSTYDNYKVIVADNGSTDNSVQFLEEFYPQLQILRSVVNKGFAKGYNDALKYVAADYYVLLNNDVEVQPGWIEPVMELMQSDIVIAACQPKVLGYIDKKRFEYAGACGGWIDSFGYPFARGRIFDVCEIDTGQYDTIQQIFWATGACFFVRAEAFHSIAGFDEFFFAHQEEIDLCWRLQHEGYKIFVQPASLVYHVGGGTLPMGDKYKVYLNFRNNLIMLTKNLPEGQALWKIPFRIGLDIIAGLKGLFAGRVVTLIAILKAHIHYLRWLFFERSKNRFKGKNKTRLHSVYKGLVIWQYFVNGKKAFSEIVTTKDNI
jgi:GT2 family glycosyltransferase